MKEMKCLGTLSIFILVFIIVQHFLLVAELSLFEIDQTIWLIVCTTEFLLIIVGASVLAKRKEIRARLISSLSIITLIPLGAAIAILIKDFSFAFVNLFWVSTSSLIILTLVLLYSELRINRYR